MNQMHNIELQILHNAIHSMGGAGGIQIIPLFHTGYHEVFCGLCGCTRIKQSERMKLNERQWWLFALTTPWLMGKFNYHNYEGPTL